MFHDLSMLARARERDLQREVSNRQARRLPRRRPARRLSRIVGRAMCRMGSVLVSVGRRLECYELRLIGKSDLVTG